MRKRNCFRVRNVIFRKKFRKSRLGYLQDRENISARTLCPGIRLINVFSYVHAFYITVTS